MLINSIHLLSESCQTGILSLNSSIIFSLLRVVFFGLIAGVGYCSEQIGITLQLRFANLKISFGCHTTHSLILICFQRATLLPTYELVK